MTTTDMTVAEIGFELGYNDKAYFTSVFKKKSGQTDATSYVNGQTIAIDGGESNIYGNS